MGKISNELLDPFADEDLLSLPPNDHLKKIIKILASSQHSQDFRIVSNGDILSRL